MLTLVVNESVSPPPHISLYSPACFSESLHTSLSRLYCARTLFHHWLLFFSLLGLHFLSLLLLLLPGRVGRGRLQTPGLVRQPVTG